MHAAGLDATLAVVLTPFAAALLAPVVVRLIGAAAAPVLALVPAAMFLHFLGYLTDVSEGARVVVSADWIPALGVRFSILIDGLSLLFALLVTGIGAAIVVYSGGYLKGHPHLGRFLGFIFFFMGSMLGLVLADDLLALFVFWELTSIASFLLIGFDHTRERARRAALQALLVTGGGGLVLLAGLLLLSRVTGMSGLAGLLALRGGIADLPAVVPITLLVLVGAFTKSAQVPLHFWLPNAMEAPTPVSAYLHSATMVKAGVYLLMRLQPVLGGTELWTTVLPLFGGATLVTGALLAIRQTDLKFMLAYTTVASLGLLVMLTGTSNPRAIEGAALYLLAHSLFKGALFMVAGAVDHEAGTRDVRLLGGLRRGMPVTFAAALLAGLSMAGLPPFIGFVAKEVLYEGLADTAAAAALIAAAVVGNALMLAVAATVALKPFLGSAPTIPGHGEAHAGHGHAGGAGGHGHATRVHEAPVALWIGPLVLAVLGLAAALALGWTGTHLVGPVASAVIGRRSDVDLHLVPGSISLPLLLSLLTIGLGVLLFLFVERVRAGVDRAFTAIGTGPDRWFDHALASLVRFGHFTGRLVQPGRLELYIVATFVLVAVALGVPSLLGGRSVSAPAFAMPTLYEGAVVALAVIGLFAVAVAESRLVAILALGIQGFAVALLYLLFGAPDLSFTQFMVETLSVVILALVMTRLDLEPSDHRTLGEAVPELVLSVAVGVGFAVLLLEVLAQPFNPALSDFFATYSRAIAHGRNIVNVIIVDFRGLDTLGEITVVMITGMAVLALVAFRAGGGTKPGAKAGKDTGEDTGAKAGRPAGGAGERIGAGARTGASGP